MSLLKRKEKKEEREEAKRVRAESREAKRKAKSLSLDRRLRNMEKELSTQTQRQRQRRFKARDVLSFIGYDALYADGIAQVEEGLFSQTIAFSDISYQSAREENQKTIFSIYCQLFDYFGADTSLQLSVINTPIPADEIGRKVFFAHVPEGMDGYVEEYNRILNDKMREGVSNLVRERYLTFSVGAADILAAVPKLARIRGDVIETLSRIRCQCRIVGGDERLEILNSQLRPGHALIGGFDCLHPKSGLRTKDLIAPCVMDFEPEDRSDCFRLDDMYGQVLAFKGYGSELSDKVLASIIDLQLPMNTTLHVQGMEKSKGIAFVKRRIAWMDKEIIDDQMDAVKKGHAPDLLSPELRYSKEDAERLLDDLQNTNQRLFVFTGLIYTYAPTLDALDRQVEQIASVARQHSIELDILDYRQRQGLNSILPLGHNHVEVSRMLTTGQVAVMMPFASQELNQEGGGYYGQSKQSGNLVVCNRKMLASPMGFACGKPGSGKSFSMKREILNTYLAYPEDEIIVFDPAGEYSILASVAGGMQIKFSADSDTFMNPFDLADVADKADVSQLAFKIDAFLALSSATMAEGSQGLSEADKSIIARCVELAYEQAGEEGRIPQIGDFYDILSAQPEREAKNIALRYERYVKGALSFFNNQSNVSFDNRITNIDFRDLNSNMRVFGMLTALEAVRNRMYANFERGVTTWLYIDEVQSLFCHPSIISYFSKFWAEGRKFNLICTGITQNSVYMLEHEEARNMVLNSDFVLLHKQSAVDKQAWVKMLDLSATEAEYIDEAIKPGEGLLIAGGARVPIKDDFPKGALYDLFNTKPEEIAAIKRAQRFASNASQRRQ
jgi:hypothetical protein